MAAKTPNPCAELVKKALGEELSDKQTEEIVERLERRAANRRKRTPGLDEQDALIEAANDLAVEQKTAALIEKRSRLINRAADARRRDYLKRATDAGMKASQAIRAKLVGVEGPWAESADSVDARARGMESNELVGPMIGELRTAGLLDAVTSTDRTFELRVADEMARANGDTRVAPTGDKHAEAVAKIYNRYIETGRVMQNDSGAHTPKLEGYVARQSHDQLSVRGDGTPESFAKWRDVQLRVLDERTFDDAIDREEFLRLAWDAISANDHVGARGADAGLSDGFSGPGNMAKRLSADRVFIYKSPAAWMEYNALYGRTSLFESVLNTLRFAARNTALMQEFGTNPEMAFDAWVRAAADKAGKASDLKEQDELLGSQFKAEFREISGGFGERGNPTLAMYAGTSRALVNTMTLGGILASALPDIAVRISVLKHNGIGLLEGYRSSLLGLFEGMTNKEKRRAADDMGAGVQGVLGTIADRYNHTGRIADSVSKMSTTFFKWNIMTAWTDGWSRGTALKLARSNANDIREGKAFADLPPREQTTLRRHGIGEKEWSLFSKVDLRVADGEHYLLSDSVNSLSDADIKAYMGKPDATERDLRLARRELRTKLGTYYTQQVRDSMTIADAGDRVALNLRTDTGTPVGEVWRTFAHLKQYPVTYWRKHLRRELRRGGKTDVSGLAHLIVMTTLLGYASITLKDLAMGRGVREVDDGEDAWKLVLASMAKGGGLSLIGDALFTEANHSGLASMVAGPTVGLAERYQKVVKAAMRGEDFGAKLVGAAVSTVPFNNLLYTRLGLDWLILRDVQESLNPGYLRRYERQIERDYNVEHWMPPTETAEIFD